MTLSRSAQGEGPLPKSGGTGGYVSKPPATEKVVVVAKPAAKPVVKPPPPKPAPKPVAKPAAKPVARPVADTERVVVTTKPAASTPAPPKQVVIYKKPVATPQLSRSASGEGPIPKKVVVTTKPPPATEVARPTAVRVVPPPRSVAGEGTVGTQKVGYVAPAHVPSTELVVMPRVVKPKPLTVNRTVTGIAGEGRAVVQRIGYVQPAGPGRVAEDVSLDKAWIAIRDRANQSYESVDAMLKGGKPSAGNMDAGGDFAHPRMIDVVPKMSALQVEQALAEQERLQKVSGGAHYDADLVGALLKRYMALTGQLNSDYVAAQTQISRRWADRFDVQIARVKAEDDYNAAIIADAKKAYDAGSPVPPDILDTLQHKERFKYYQMVQQAGKIFGSSDWQKLFNEFTRVNGFDPISGGAPSQPNARLADEYRPGYGDAQGTAVAFVGRYERMVSSQAEFAGRALSGAIAAARQTEGRAAIVGMGLDPGGFVADKPDFVNEWVLNSSTGRMEQTTRTLSWDETATLRRKQVADELAAARTGERASVLRMRQTGEDQLKGKDTAIAAELGPIMASRGYSSFFLTTPQGSQALIDEAMRLWDARNPRPSGATMAQSRSKFAGWQASRLAHEKDLYQYIGMEGAPSILDRVFQIPGVTEGASALQYPWSSLWGSIKATVQQTTGGELVGPGYDPNILGRATDLFGKWRVDPTTAVVGAVLQGFSARPGTTWGFGIDKSPEAVKRAKAAHDELVGRIAAANASGDVWAAVKATNEYAASPFSEDSGLANTLAQLVDPTNLIPLNVLTWGARATLALRAAKDVGTLGKIPEFVRTFSRVTDVQIRMLGEAKSIFERAGVIGAEDAAKEWASRLVGLGPDAARRKTEDLLAELKLSRRSPVTAQLMAVAEDTLSRELRAAGHDVIDQVTARDAEQLLRAEANDQRILQERVDAAANKAKQPSPPRPPNATSAQLRALREAEVVKGGRVLHAEAKKIIKEEELGLFRDPQYAPLASTAKEVDAEAARAMRVRVVTSEFGPYLDQVGHGVDSTATHDLAKKRLASGATVIEGATTGPWAKEMPGIALTDYQAMEKEVQAEIQRVRGVSKRGAGLSKYVYTEDLTRAEIEQAKAVMAQYGGPVAGKTPAESYEIQKAIARVVHAHGYKISEYSRAHAVLQPVLLRSNAAKGMLRRVAGAVDPAAAYRALRHTSALHEADLRLGHLARQMFPGGATAQHVVDKFIRDHSYQGEKLAGGGIDRFQAYTLAGAYTDITGHGMHETGKVADYMATEAGRRPPMVNRQAFRDYMVANGEWTPRTAAAFDRGEAVWTAEDARAYFDAHFATVPDWLNEAKMSDAGFFDDPVAHADFIDRTSGFDQTIRQQALKGLTTDEARLAVIEGRGDLLPRYDLSAERAFNAQFWGNRVAMPIVDSAGKITGYRFHAMPWLMTAEEKGAYDSVRVAKGVPAVKALLGQKGMEQLGAFYSKHLGEVYKELEKMPLGAPITSEQIQRWAMEFANMAMNDVGKWAKDTALADPLLHRTLSAWGTFSRATIVWNPAFAIVNTPDLLLRAPYARFVNRSIEGVTTSREIGWAAHDVSEETTTLFERKRFGMQKYRDPLASRATRDKIEGPLEEIVQAPVTLLGKAETAFKRSLYAKWAAGAFDYYVHDLGMTEQMAEAAARTFAKKELDRVWFTMYSKSPIYRLLNEVSPFLNYQLRNQVFWIKEVFAHPALFRKLAVVNQVIQRENLKGWAREHPEDPDGSTMPANLRNRVQLPGTDLFFDLSVLSDAGRGLQVFSGKPMTINDHLAKFIRVISPAPQAAVNWLEANFAGAGSWKWVSDGTGSGKVRVWVQPGEPWSGDPVTLGSVLWPFDVADLYGQLTKDGKFDLGDFYQFAHKLFFYTEMASPNPITVAQAIYFDLNERDHVAAAAYLARHPEVVAYWKSGGTPRDVMIPTELQPWMQSLDPADKLWYEKSQGFRQQVAKDRDGLHVLIAGFDAEGAAYVNQPWDPRYKELQARKRAAIAAYYLSHPSLIEADASTKTTAEWRALEDQWQVDADMGVYQNLMAKKPFRSDFPTDAEFSKAYDAWQHEKDVFLAASPGVERILAGRGGTIGQAVADLHNTWGEIIDYRAALHQYSVDAQEAGLPEAQALFGKMDYYAKEALAQDTIAMVYEPLDIGGTVSALLGGKPIPARVPHLTVPPDYFANQWAKAPPAEKARLVKDAWYQTQMGMTVQEASSSGTFDPGKFKSIVQHDPRLSAIYFEKHPGKKQEWAHADAYHTRHEAYVALIKAKRYDDAQKAFDAWPDWMKQRYWDATVTVPHVTSSGDIVKWQVMPHTKAIMAANRAYGTAMAKWGALLDAKQYDKARSFFSSLPPEIQQRYWDTHPSAKPYADAMQQWSKLIAAGNWTKANAYFDSLPDWIKNRYYTNNPGKKEAKAANATYIAAMQQWIHIGTTQGWDKAQKFFDSLPGWVRDRYHAKHPENRKKSVATAAYLGYMQHWTKLIGSKNFAAADAYFKSLPGWAKDKYFSGPKGAERRQAASYRGYMDKWVGLIAKGDHAAAAKYFDSLPGWAKDRYYNDPKEGAARRKTRDYIALLEPWSKALDAGDFDGARKIFDKLPGWAKDRYYSDPVKGAERRQTRDYVAAMDGYTALLDKKDFVGARAYLEHQPKWVQDRYYNDPVKGPERRANKAYGDAMAGWIDLIQKGDEDAADAYFAALPPVVKERYFTEHPEARATQQYVDHMRSWSDLIAAKKFDEADAYFAALPKAEQDRYYAKHPEAVATETYISHMEAWTKLLAAKDWGGAKAYFDGLPKAERDRYFAKHPDRRGADGLYQYAGAGLRAAKPALPRAAAAPARGGTVSDATAQYVSDMGKWYDMVSKKDFTAAKTFFDGLPVAERLRYFSKHPEHKAADLTYKYLGGSAAPSFADTVPLPSLPAPSLAVPKPGPVYQPKPTFPNKPAPASKQSLNYVDLTVLDAYFKLPADQQGAYLALHPDLSSFLASHTPDDKRIQTAIIGGLSAIEDPWLRRIYQEQHPEVFDPAAKAAARIAGIEKKLAAHPELVAEYQRILDEIHFTYAQSLHHHLHVPQAFLKPVHPPRKRRHEVGRSASATAARSRHHALLLGPPRQPRDRPVLPSGARRIVGAGGVADVRSATGSAATLSRRRVV